MKYDLKEYTIGQRIADRYHSDNEESRGLLALEIDNAIIAAKAAEQPDGMTKILTADERDNVWLDDSGDEWQPVRALKRESVALSAIQWHEEDGDVLWWNFPINEPPYCGTPLDTCFPVYKTHWTRLTIPTGIEVGE